VASPSHVVDLIHLGIEIDTRLWLLADSHLSEEHHQLLASWDVLPGTAEDFHERWERRPVSGHVAGQPPERAAAAFPAVPPDDFPTFYARARRELSAGDFALVDSLYRTSFTEGLRIFANGTPDEEDLSAALHDLVAGLVTKQEALVAIRGVQAAALRNGVLVKVDPERFLTRAGEISGAARLQPEDWARLGCFCEPSDAAVGVLAALGIDAKDIATLPATEVAADGSTVLSNGSEIAVPTEARRYLVALHLFRLSVGASDDGLFLEQPRGRFPASATSVGRTILKVSRISGLALKARRMRTQRAAATHWTHRFGLCIQELST